MIVFDYGYRDSGNNKSGGFVVLENDSQFSIEELEAEIRKYLSDSEHFIAEQIDVPEVFLWDPDAMYDPDDPNTYPSNLGAGNYMLWDDMDHCWHEFLCLDHAAPHMRPTDSRTITEFISDIKKASKKGWNVFQPIDRRTATA